MMRKLLLSTCLAGVLSAFAGAGASAAELWFWRRCPRLMRLLRKCMARQP